MSVKIHGDNSASSCGFATGDGDTGIMPGSDVVDVVTGGTSRIKAENATTTISNNLSVTGTSAFTGTTTLGNTKIEANTSGRLKIQRDTDTSAALLVVNAAGDTNKHILYGDGNVSFAEGTATITPTGEASFKKVNIRKDTSAANTAFIKLENRSAGGAVTNAHIEFQLENSNANDPKATIGAVENGTDGYADLVFQTSPQSNSSTLAEKFRIRAGGGVCLNGEVDDNHTLNDYEEGTFVPTWSNGFAPGGYSAQHGRYTKIGNVVYFQLTITASSGSVAASHLRIGGLPFNAESASPPYGGAWIVYTTIVANTNSSDGVPPYCLIVNGTDDIYLYRRDGNFWNANDGVGTVVNKEIRVNGFYTV